MKIFWSWQSDHPGNISRHLVREALELSVESLNEELAIEEPEREATLDHDRKGVPGSPDLANVILEKIRASDVFVADVTPVGATFSTSLDMIGDDAVPEELRSIGRNRLKRWEEIGVEAIESDLVHGGGIRHVGSHEVQSMAWRWVRWKKAQADAAKA